MTNFIQQYLDRGLFNIADNEERLQKLQSSAESLADAFAENKAFVVQFLRASLIAHIDEGSPAFSRIEEHIKADWPTFRSAQPERPIAILLAVGWQALHLAVAKVSRLVGVDLVRICESADDGHNRWPFGNGSRLRPISGPKCGNSRGFRMEFQQRRNTAPAPSLHFTRDEINASSCLSKGLASVNAEGAAIEGGNPHSPPDAAWAAFFSKAAAAGITAALTQQSEKVRDSVQVSLNDLQTAIGVEVRRSLKAESRRTELLWLAQSLFSPRALKGYRELSPHEAVLVLAVDMAEVAAGLSPQSVEFFLAETVERLFPSQSAKLETFVRDVAKSTVRSALPVGLFSQVEAVPPAGLLELTGAIARNAADIKQFTALTGLPKNKAAPLGALARWVYREIKFRECVKEDLWL